MRSAGHFIADYLAPAPAALCPAPFADTIKAVKRLRHIVFVRISRICQYIYQNYASNITG